MTAGGARPGDDRTPRVVSGRTAGAREVWVEIPAADGNRAAWCYSDERSYRPGDTVHLFVSSTEPHVDLTIYRDGADLEPVHRVPCLTTRFQDVPERAYATGCGWEPTVEYTIPDDAPSCGYLVELALPGRPTESDPLGHHFFAVGPAPGRPRAAALVLATATWTAYDDFGGASHYFGLHPGSPRGRSPLLSSQRPWARGQVWLPGDAPRMVSPNRPRRPRPARYEAVEWAALHGFAKYYAAAGWATYERHFLRWAERTGYQFDLLTQEDLHFSPHCLEPYDCVVFVGHDEYWTAEMREVVDAYVESGGNVARFAGNFMWQIRLEDRGRTQVAYKYDARAEDPVAGTSDRSRMTGAWEDPVVGNPGATTFGVNALRGMYAGMGGMAARGGRGFVTFRPEHWAFARTGLGYADMFGDEVGIFAYEVDGLDYVFRDGLPFPTHGDGAPEGLQILGMNWSTASEHGLDEHRSSLMLGDGDARFRAEILDGDPDAVASHSRMSGMVVSFTRGRGEVFTAATCEWVNALAEGDFHVETVTRNVLDRFLS